MECITNAVADAAKAAGVSVTTFIDNVRFGGREEGPVARSAARFKEIVASCGGQVNDEPGNHVHTQGVFLGVIYDYQKKTTRLTEEKVQKLKEAKRKMERDPTMGDVFSAFGLLFFASQVLRYGMDTEYHTFKFYRRRAAEHAQGTGYALHEQANIWECIKPRLKKWFATLIRNEPADRTIRREEVTLFTDASLTGAGAMLFTEDGLVFTFAAKWTNLEKSRRIEELEARAITLAVRYFEDHLRGKHIDLRVDNTSVIGALNKGYSKSYNLNKHVSEALGAIGRHFTVQYVRSAQNLADGLSRLRNPTTSYPLGMESFKKVFPPKVSEEEKEEQKA